MVTRRHLDEILAACDNIARLSTQTPHPVIVRRFNEWSTDFVRAASYDPPTRSRVETINGEPVTLPPLTDPTGDQATTRPDTIDYRAAVTELLGPLLRFEKALSEATRPGTATREEATTTDQGASTHRVGSGECEACGRFLPGGPEPRNRIKPLYGHALCPTHNRGAHRDLQKGVPLEKYITSTRARLGRT